MVSIAESLSDLEYAHQTRRVALDLYISAVRSAAQYAIDLEEEITAPHRRQLNALADELSRAEAGVLNDSRATLRGLLRDYREKAANYINRIREDLGNSAGALEEIVSSLVQSDGDQETNLRAGLAQLRGIAKEHPSLLGGRLVAAISQVERSCEEMRKQHKMTLAQFQVEIRMLHQRIDALERAAMLNSVSELLSRGQVEASAQEWAAESYSLLLLRTAGIIGASRQFGASVGKDLAGAFGKRLRNSVPPDAILGRWSEEGFIVKTSHSKRIGISAVKGISEAMSGSYSCLHCGKTVRPSIQVSAAIVDRGPDEPPARTLQRVADFFGG